MEPPQAAVQRTSYFQSRYIRLIIGGILITITIMGLAVVSWSMYRSSRTQPIAVEPYPDAQILSSSKTERGDRILYATNDSVQKVFEFYSGKLPKDDANGCRKIYTDTQPSEELGHYFGRCVVDNSFGDINQWLAITINYQTTGKLKAPQTIIEVSRDWGG